MQAERMKDVREMVGQRQAALVIGCAVGLLVATTVLFVPYFGASVCFGWNVQDCGISWTSPVGVPTNYPLWVGVQLGIIAVAVLLQVLFLRLAARGR